MKNLIIIISILICLYPLFGQNNINCTWYRNEIFHSAELIINNDNTFKIEATSTAHFGEISGLLYKLNNTIFYSHIIDEVLNKECLLVFLTVEDSVKVILYGTQIGAGHTVYYDGLYEKNKISENEYINKAPDYIIGDKFNHDKLKILLGDDILYFIQCFAKIENFEPKEKDVELGMEGCMPGVAVYQNGIILLNEYFIYILFTDCREEKIGYRYYSNELTRNELPIDMAEWVKIMGERPIIKNKN